MATGTVSFGSRIPQNDQPPNSIGTWTGAGVLAAPRYDKNVAGSSTAALANVIAHYSPGGYYAAVGYPQALEESYYSVKNNMLQAFITFPETTSLRSDLSGDWFLQLYAVPLPKSLDTPFRICGTATHGTFGGRGTDFLMEWSQGNQMFKFLIMHHGFLQILNASNVNTYIESFFGTYGGISINLEYEI